MHDSIAVTPKVDIKAAVWAGVIAGITFMMLEMIMVAVFNGQSP